MKNLKYIYKIMLKHYGYLIAGLIFMLGYALFSGASVSMAVPFFDYAFPQVKPEIVYNDFPAFITEFKSITSQFVSETSVFRLFNLNQLRPLLAEYGEMLEATDSMLVLKLISALILGIILLKNVFFYLNRLMFANLNGKTIVDIRNTIFENYLRQSFSFFNHYRVGDSLVRMVSDVEIVSRLFITSMFNAVRDLLLVLVFMRLAIFLNLRLFLISLILLPLTTYMVATVGKKIKKYARRIQAQFSDIYSRVEEVLNNIKIVKAFAREKEQYNSFRKINDLFFKYWRKAEIYSGMNVPISELNGAITGILLLIIGGSEVLSGSSTFTFGEFSAFLFAIFSMLHPLKTISKTYTEVKKAMVSLDRITEVIHHEPEIKEKADPLSKRSFDHSIVFDRVIFSYLPDRVVLNNISFEIKKGEKVAAVGSSGSGKTTITSLLLRFYDPDSGEIRIDGIPLSDLKLDDLRNLYGIVTQESLLFTDTVADNIRFGTNKEISDDEIKMACKTAYVDELIDTLPEKYDHVLQSKGTTLSGGQKQRLCIARAIVGDPPILILDEATSSLDTEAEQKVQLAIEQATKKRTVFIIAHRLSTVLSADKIIVLDDGKIVGCGKHQELLSNCPRYRLLYDLQFNL